MRISEVALASGCNLETIRYYERVGLTPRPGRQPNGYRSYSKKEVRRLRFIARARDLGFSLQEIRDLLRLEEAPTLSCADADQIARTHLAAIQHRIRELGSIATELERVIANCTGTACGGCTILDALRHERVA